MKSRLPGRDPEFIAKLQASIEQQLARHLSSGHDVAPTRRMYVWDSLANDYRQLALLAYAAGGSCEHCRKLFIESARAHLELVKLRGDGSESRPDWTPPPEYATGNSRSTFEAICRAFVGCDWELARLLAPWVWDPEGSGWISPNSLLCTPQQQTMAYALKDFLLGRTGELETRLRSMTNIREDLIGEMLMLRGIILGDSARTLKGLGLALSWHHRMAKQEDFNPEYFVCTTALGLAALAIQHKVVAKEDLPADDVYLSRDLIFC
jgi:hypothetical protein